MNNFDLIAPVYDQLAKLVFGKNLHLAQKEFIHRIPQNSKILILGGGTGQILIDLLHHTPGSQIFYQEASSKMLRLSQKRLQKELPSLHQQVVFFYSSDCSHLPPNNFDVVITPFVLDVFNEEEISPIFEHIHRSLRSRGIWLWADFSIPQNGQQYFAEILIQSMYFFFRMLSQISAKKLPDIERYFQEYDYQLLLQKGFLREMVQTRLYQKIS